MKYVLDKCIHCGQEVFDHTEICFFCGHKICRSKEEVIEEYDEKDPMFTYKLKSFEESPIYSGLVKPYTRREIVIEDVITKERLEQNYNDGIDWVNFEKYLIFIIPLSIFMIICTGGIVFIIGMIIFCIYGFDRSNKHNEHVSKGDNPYRPYIERLLKVEAEHQDKAIEAYKKARRYKALIKYGSQMEKFNFVNEDSRLYIPDVNDKEAIYKLEPIKNYTISFNLYLYRYQCGFDKESNFYNEYIKAVNTGDYYKMLKAKEGIRRIEDEKDNYFNEELAPKIIKANKLAKWYKDMFNTNIEDDLEKCRYSYKEVYDYKTYSPLSNKEALYGFSEKKIRELTNYNADKINQYRINDYYHDSPLVFVANIHTNK